MKNRPLLFLIFLTSAGFAQEKPLEFFESKIRPVLDKHCYECHSESSEKVKGELLLDTKAGMLRGGATGPAVVPYKLEESLLIEAVRYHDTDIEMPPKKSGGKLPDSVIADLEAWVKMGAPDPRTGDSKVAKSYDAEKAKSWWAYQPVTSPTVPRTAKSSWAQTEIDQFILAKLEAENLQPVGDADKNSLLRRLFLDLTGLPPTPDFIEKYQAAPNPATYERIVDWLLASPDFGERWGRHWLDVARYAETTGRDINVTLPQAWRYRDYVIDAFNADMPFDQFIREQIAGDLLPAKDEAVQAEKLIATGFLAIGPKGLNETDPRQFEVDLADEQIDTVTQAFMGMTVSCARCHDHKFDPISQRDYTAMAGIFLSTANHFGTPGGVRARNASTLLEIDPAAGLETHFPLMDPDERARKERQRASLVQQSEEARAFRRANNGKSNMNAFDMVRMVTQAKQIEIELAAYNEDGSVKTRVIGVQDKPATDPPIDPRASRRPTGGPNASKRANSGFLSVGDSPLFSRGDIEKEKETVPRGVPNFLSRGHEIDIPEGASGRLELANWIASTDNTLTARVTVNRVWHWLFGRGLVESVDNFGASGAAPSHPELLDYLATKFIEDEWSIKKLIKRIVMSRVFRIGSHHAESNFVIDPGNQYLWRSNARRLDAETIRDSMLAASGLLEKSPEGGSMIARAGDGPIGGNRFNVLTDAQIEKAAGTARSIYLPVARNIQPEVLAIFDFAEPSSVLGSRETTIVPPQTLYLMNSDFVEKQATALAERVMKENGFDHRFTLACRLTWCRDPLSGEKQAARRLDQDDLDSWTSICRALFASADFLFAN